MNDTQFILNRLAWVLENYQGEEALEKVKFLVYLWKMEVA